MKIDVNTLMVLPSSDGCYSCCFGPWDGHTQRYCYVVGADGCVRPLCHHLAMVRGIIPSDYVKRKELLHLLNSMSIKRVAPSGDVTPECVDMRRLDEWERSGQPLRFPDGVEGALAEHGVSAERSSSGGDGRWDAFRADAAVRFASLYVSLETELSKFSPAEVADWSVSLADALVRRLSGVAE